MKHRSGADAHSDAPKYDDPRHGGTEAEIRSRVYPEPLVLIPGLLTSGLTILAAGPKIGKSVLSQQIEHYLGAGIAFKGWPAPRQRHRVLVLDLEGNGEATQDTSLRLAPDADNKRFSNIVYRYQADLPMQQGMPGLLAWLTAELTEAAAAGAPYTYVRIDTLRLFIGPNGGRTNAYDFDAQAIAALNQLALGLGCAILALHHLSKASEESGDWLERLSGSMGVSGSATSIWLLERARGANTGVWRTTSRRLREAEHALTYIDGVWAFAEDLTVDQASHTGVPRAVVDYLTKHPTATWRELRTLGKPETVRKALTRLGRQRVVQQVEGIWSLVRQPQDPAQQPEPAQPPSTGWAPGSIGDAMTRMWERYGGDPEPVQPEIPSPAPEAAPEAVPAPEPEPDRPEPRPEQAKTAMTRLKEAIGTVETRPCRPIPLIRREDRQVEPWTIAVRASTNRHSWLRPDAHELPGDRRVVVIDRRGSYPSAMSSVPVAPNILLHTGPLTYIDPRKAGLYLIEVPRDGTGGRAMGHVLGADAREETLWVTAPSLRAVAKVIGRTPKILDSWTGKAVSSLFEGFYKWCRDTRAELLGSRPPADSPAELEAWEAAYADHKKQSSVAIRLIHPRSRESGLWRPDWHAAIVAEANVRHWWAAARSGAELLAMSNHDEAAYLVPEGAPEDWTPPGYTVGPAFGHVSIKERAVLGDWLSRKGKRIGHG